MNATDEIDKFIEEWVHTAVEVNKAAKHKDFSSFRDTVILQSSEPNNFVNQAGYGHLLEAASLLLREMKLTQKISRRTAVNAIVRAHFELVPRALEKKRFSGHAIASRAKETIKAAPRASGLYIYPLVFAPGAKNSDWGFGPVRILSKEKFLAQYGPNLEKEREDKTDDFRARLLADWQNHSEAYDHFALVEVPNHERELAEKIGREIAEFVLNLIRMHFGFYHTDDIRIGGGYIFEAERSSLYIDNNGNAVFSSSRGPYGTHLDDRWTESIDYTLGQMLPMFGSYLHWFVNGGDPTSPILERIRYASALIAEAYAEPHDHMRLVRLISALEAFALIGGSDKAHHLALHCGLVGGRGDLEKFHEIFDAIKVAYRARNAIVHGDRLPKNEIREAFFRVEKYALRIVVAFVSFFENIQTLDRPQSIGQLRRIVKRRATLYFWMPEIASGL